MLNPILIKKINELSEVIKLLSLLNDSHNSFKELIIKLDQEYITSISRQFQKWDAYLYYFSTKSEVSSAEIARYKSSKMEWRSMARINENLLSETLYTGSSHDLGKRLKEHCWYGNKNTYALNLKYWINPEREVIFHFLKIDDDFQGVLHFIEDWLSEMHQPAFWRKWTA